jgi:hypothetical protein
MGFAAIPTMATVAQERCNKLACSYNAMIAATVLFSMRDCKKADNLQYKNTEKISRHG